VMQKSKKYYVVKCPNCRYIFITRGVRVRCRRCGRSFKSINYAIKETSDYNVALAVYYKLIGHPMWIKYKNEVK